MTTTVGPLLPGGIHIGRTPWYTNVNIGDQGYSFLGNETSAAFGTGTTFTWVSSIFIPRRMTIAKMGYLVGSVGGFGFVEMMMYNYRGNAVLGLTPANGAVPVVGTANTFQLMTCNVPFNVQGPGIFWITVSITDTRSRIKVIPTSTASFGPLTMNTTGSWNGTTFTLPLLSSVGTPTAFTPDVGPYVFVQEE